MRHGVYANTEDEIIRLLEQDKYKQKEIAVMFDFPEKGFRQYVSRTPRLKEAFAFNRWIGKSTRVWLKWRKCNCGFVAHEVEFRIGNRCKKCENERQIAAAKANGYKHQKAYFKRDKGKASLKRYRENNPDKMREYANRYYDLSIKTNAERRIKYNIKARHREVLNKFGYIGVLNHQELLKCSYIALNRHIESKFQDGMSWDNYGEWELDHIYPFGVCKDIEQAVEACHYKNIQPLWKEDNQSKWMHINN